ncbi:sensor histidine kinase [Spirillospora albida]|uniref:sensor histidine kinase n=1 Tax=Spirillospora albida TaxID=58123 RepID=UPI00069132EA|nr:sensor histidine kinase [Spirillospora albida]
MRARRGSIRFTLFGLLTIPLVSLVALWGFAAQGAVSDALEKRNLDTVNRVYGDAATAMLVQVAQERTESVMWLSARGQLPRTAMDAQRRRTDGTLDSVRRAFRSDSFRRGLNDEMKQRLATMESKIDQLGAVRQGIDSGTTAKLTVFNSYNDVMDAHFGLVFRMIGIKDHTIYRQAYQLTQASLAQELAARSATLGGGALIAGGVMSADERATFTRLVNEQRYLMADSIAQFEPRISAPYAQLLASPAYRELRALEDRIMAHPGGRARLPIKPMAWKTATETYIGGLARALGVSRNILGERSKSSGDAILLRLGLVGGVGLLAVLLSAFLMLRFGRRVSRELNGLRSAARELAEQRLPEVVGRLSRGEDVCPDEAAPPLRIGRTAEVADVAEAFSSVQRTAVEAAIGQADMRKAVNQVFRNLARRNQSLLHRQLTMLDTLERKASDPEELEDLFRIDHLTTRMRRHAEGLIILSGATPGRGWRRPVKVLDVLRGAIGEIEDYQRVEVASNAEESVVGGAVADLIHLLAELVENAVSFSPPNTHVEINAGLVGNGFVVEIHDRGLGMSPERLAAVNEQLARPPEFSLSDGDQLGLFVVGHLAHKHGIRVSLVPNAYGGLKTIVLLPHLLVVTPDEMREGIGQEPPEPEARPEFPTGPQPAYETGPQAVYETGPQASVGAHHVPRHMAQPQPQPEPQTQPRTQPQAAPVPVTVPAQGPAAEDANGGNGANGATHAGMPRRVRRANLAPELRGGGANGTGETPRPGGRSPDRARSVMASMQSGWQRGRATPTGADDSGDREPDPGAGNRGER